MRDLSLFTIIFLIIVSCLVLPKTENNSHKRCKLVTKNWTFEVHKFGNQSNCDNDCSEFVRSIIDCGKSEDCIQTIAVVTVGWTVVAASVVGVGNTVHWIEKQGRCKESTVRNSINQLYAKTVDVGGFFLETGKDFVDLLMKNHNNPNPLKPTNNL